MPEELPIAAAKARFAECVRQAERGGAIVLTRHGRPVARLSPIDDQEAREPRIEGASAEVGESAGSYTTRPASALGSSTPAARKTRREGLERLLEDIIWPRIPKEQLGQGIDKKEREQILGYGSDGI